jgi:hypothetical protein
LQPNYYKLQATTLLQVTSYNQIATGCNQIIACCNQIATSKFQPSYNQIVAAKLQATAKLQLIVKL